MHNYHVNLGSFLSFIVWIYREMCTLFWKIISQVVELIIGFAPRICLH